MLTPTVTVKVILHWSKFVNGPTQYGD